MKIIVRVRELRKTHNLTQEELARQLHISRQSLISLEQGRWLPSLPLALQLAAFFNTPLENVIHIYANKKPREEVSMARELNPWSPFRELRVMREDLDRLFDQGLTTPGQTTFPSVNLRQDDKNLYIEAHVPGFTDKDIDIDVADDMVMISGRIEEEKKEEGKKEGYLRQEYRTQAFSRTIALPVQVASDKAEAKLTHGVLTITLPKVAEEKPKTKRLKPTS